MVKIGYSHYWYRKIEISRDDMLKIVRDFKHMEPVLVDLKVYLAGGQGEGKAVVNLRKVYFNGPTHCGHSKNEEISIPWPSKDAGGVAKYGENRRAGNWFAGAVINKRCCDGDCSYETFYFPQILKKTFLQRNEKSKLYFNCCKTAYRPYDLAINIFLVIAKHRLKDEIQVTSDGEMIHWKEAMMLCQIHLGYGENFKLGRE